MNQATRAFALEERLRLLETKVELLRRMLAIVLKEWNESLDREAKKVGAPK